MKNEKKYEFTNEQANELKMLRKMFDVIMENAHPYLWTLINKSELTQSETTFMESELIMFDEVILMTKYRNYFLRMIDLIELESNYNKQEFIKQMLNAEQYEILANLKKLNCYKEFFE
jgi:hypothetical protein